MYWRSGATLAIVWEEGNSHERLGQTVPARPLHHHVQQGPVLLQRMAANDALGLACLASIRIQGDPAMTEHLAAQLKRLCCAETEGKFFDCVTDNIDEIISALRSRNQMVAALTEAERFMAYFSGETGGHFVGPGMPAACLAEIRAALPPSDRGTELG